MVIGTWVILVCSCSLALHFFTVKNTDISKCSEEVSYLKMSKSNWPIAASPATKKAAIKRVGSRCARRSNILWYLQVKSATKQEQMLGKVAHFWTNSQDLTQNKVYILNVSDTSGILHYISQTKPEESKTPGRWVLEPSVRHWIAIAAGHTWGVWVDLSYGKAPLSSTPQRNTWSLKGDLIKGPFYWGKPILKVLLDTFIYSIIQLHNHHCKESCRRISWTLRMYYNNWGPPFIGESTYHGGNDVSTILSSMKTSNQSKSLF